MDDFPEWDLEYRCRACNEMYDERSDAIECFAKHTSRVSEMIERVVSGDPNFRPKEP